MCAGEGGGGPAVEPAVERENRKVRGSRSLLSRVSDPFFFNFFILLNLDPDWFSGLGHRWNVSHQKKKT